MDAGPSEMMRCPTLDTMLKKTVLALCEVNVRYNQKLEICGSIHIRSDDQKVLTCLLDEQIVNQGGVQRDGTRDSMVRDSFRAVLDRMAEQRGKTTPSSALVHPLKIAEAALLAASQDKKKDGDCTSTDQGSEKAMDENMETEQSSLHNGHCDENKETLPSRDSTPMKQLSNDAEDSGQEVNNPNALDLSNGNDADNISESQDTNDVEEASNSNNEEEAKMALQLQTLHQQMLALNQMAELMQRNVGLVLPIQGTAINMGTPQQQMEANLLASMAAAGALNQPGPSLAALNTTMPIFPNNAPQNMIHGIPPQQSPSSAGLQPTPPRQSPNETIKQDGGLENREDLPTVGQASQQPVHNEGQQTMAHLLAANQMQVAMLAAAGMTPNTQSNGAASPETPTSTAAVRDPLTIGNPVQTKTGAKKWQCGFCGILVSSKFYLSSHINAVHTRTRVYPCELCGRIFYSHGAQRIHKLRNHWVEKRHKCPHCCQLFVLPFEMRQHIQRKHKNVTT